jgi:hypothetical protein
MPATGTDPVNFQLIKLNSKGNCKLQLVNYQLYMLLLSGVSKRSQFRHFVIETFC